MEARVHKLRISALTVAISMLLASPAAADLTGFIGANSTPSTRLVRGFALGAGVLVLGFEFEYANTSEDVDALAPSLKTTMGNVLLQTPVAIAGLQPYVTTGAGLYREELEPHEKTGFGVNVGGGVKVSLAGPLRLRIDYRVFRLGEEALQSPAHRLYAGLNLKF
jgi:opacity protein-like surface antigen